MSNKKKPKKLRTPNVPSKAAGSTTPAPAVQARAGGQALASRLRPVRAAPAAAVTSFDYTYVKKDLSRIGVLAASFIIILVVLSFFIK